MMTDKILYILNNQQCSILSAWKSFFTKRPDRSPRGVGRLWPESAGRFWSGSMLMRPVRSVGMHVRCGLKSYLSAWKPIGLMNEAAFSRLPWTEGGIYPDPARSQNGEVSPAFM